MAEKGSITFSTALDNTQLEKEYQEAVKQIEKMEKELQKTTEKKSGLEEQMDKAVEAAERARQKLKELEEEQQRLQEIANGSVRIGETPSEQLQGAMSAKERLAEITEEMKEQTKEMEKQANAADRFIPKIEAVEQKEQTLTETIEEAKVHASGVGEALAQSLKGSKVSAALAGARAQFDKFFKRIGTMIKRVFMFSIILAGLRAIKNYFSEAIKQNAEAMRAVGSLKGALDALAQPLLDVVIPAFTKFVRVLAILIGYMARGVNVLFGRSIKKTDLMAKSMKKAAKETSGFVASFDELNKMNSSEDGTDAFDGEEAPGAINWDAFDENMIDEKLRAITAIVGAACLAVGAILAFSGINIPLGLSMMAIGALMLYGLAAEDWEKLPENLRTAITTCLVLTGIALVVIGAVLAFSGANLPLGIGMMVAGAALLYTALALNWGLLSKETQKAITEILVIAGVATLCIGLVLALSGVNLPLGIALIAAGAAMLASAAALNWSTLSSLIDSHMTEILVAVSGAVLAIGIILCLTGVNLPLGIAMIVAGAAGLVTAVAINWNFLVDKAKEIWAGITSWFNAHVAPIFTAGWWMDKFSTIGDGLKEAIKNGVNAGIELMNQFIGWINEKMNFQWDGLNIAGKQIIPGGSFQLLQLPKIPHLAAGAVIPPNREFAAVLGDQSSGMNIEAPEDLIRAIVREESGGGEIVALLTSILSAVEDGHNIYVDKRILGRVASEQLGNMTRMGGAY